MARASHFLRAWVVAEEGRSVVCCPIPWRRDLLTVEVKRVKARGAEEEAQPLELAVEEPPP